MTLYLDLETYSECPISHGTPRYATHPSTEILLIAYAIGDGPVGVWDPTGPTAMPLDLKRALLSDCPVVIHNSFFDRSVMRETEFFDLPPERIEDTMVQALAHGLPGSLDKLGTAFGLAEDKAKSKAGRALIHFFCKPVRGKRNFGADHPERWAQFVDYAAQDIVAMRELHRKMPRWNYPDNPRERALWCLDQRINDRGILVDTELAHAAVAAAATERETLNAATHDATDGEVAAATQRDAMLAHILREHGVTLPDMTQATLKRRLDDPALPAAVKHLLDLRMQSSRNSSAKYTAAIGAVSEDGRLRAGLQYSGAATTGRWCLAEGTPVLTRLDGTVREIPIEHVTLAHEVYDGEEWVAHEGVVYSGDKPVIEHDGVLATAEHQVYISSTESVPLGFAKEKGLRIWEGLTPST